MFERLTGNWLPKLKRNQQKIVNKLEELKNEFLSQTTFTEFLLFLEGELTSLGDLLDVHEEQLQRKPYLTHYVGTGVGPGDIYDLTLPFSPAYVEIHGGGGVYCMARNGANPNPSILITGAGVSVGSYVDYSTPDHIKMDFLSGLNDNGAWYYVVAWDYYTGSV